MNGAGLGRSELKELKEANERLAWEEERRRSPFNHALPVHLTIETTMACSLRCVMCQVYRSPAAMKKGLVGDPVMSLELFERIANETFTTAKEMTPTVMGEPLQTPFLPKMLELLSIYSVRMNIVTSGMLLSRDMSERLAPHLAKIKVSFDGATKETFESIRRGAKFETVVGNVRGFDRERRRCDPEQRPILALQVTLMRRNIEELPRIVELAADMGVDEVVGLHVYVFDQEFDNQSLMHHQELSDSIVAEATKKAKDLGIRPHFPASYRGKAYGCRVRNADPQIIRLCKFLWREVWVSHTGDITPCCVPDRPVVGSLRTSTLSEVWNGEVYQEMRRTLGSEDPFACCRHCSLRVQYEPSSTEGYDRERFLLYPSHPSTNPRK
jgi:MoaA/NifB/PqqE/SkfB family radical SAM enzyme